MKAIIFYATDNWNNDYKYVVIAQEAKVYEVIEKERNLCTEIYDYEIVGYSERE